VQATQINVYEIPEGSVKDLPDEDRADLLDLLRRIRTVKAQARMRETEEKIRARLPPSDGEVK